MAGDVQIVRHQDDADPLLFVQPLEHLQDFLARAGIQISGRFVGQQDRRMIHQGPGNGNALLLAAGKLRRLVIEALAKADAFQEFDGPAAFVAIRPRLGRIDQRHPHLLDGRAARQQIEALEDEADVAVADLGSLVGRQPRHFLAVEPIAARRRAV